MPQEAPARNGAVQRGGLSHGLLSGLILSIPLWAGIGVGIVMFVLQRPLARGEIAALAVAGVVELVLVWYGWRQIGWRFGLYRLLASLTAAPKRSPGRALVTRTALLSGLVVAYLHQYYWDVQTQIAMLPSVTVFVPVQPLG